ncbi:hypothetical protein [Brevundimonas subvibrioides]|uniref:Uncharacterized protein n=1 Tax=Brevundimonas subvibrioides (strain ATCC 15264 / DSM 4735 / LMG 14903 / NBRC 16000 / CB 81) TaxID=633149 RepID=D9QG41_BRESC|nr:hypothetical protein [Brevundimonas subvibrioides]ADL02583.1 hypothetical protein Bresu_3277 [Brevundimonas subvibrioides ATCC 15264]
MTAAIRMYVVHLPSPTQSAWQVALVEDATRAGWDVFSLTADEVPTFREGVHALIQGVDGGLIPADATTAFILAGSPQAAVDTLIQLHHLDQKTALNSVAWWFAQAAEAATHAVPMNADADCLTFPGLGEVRRAEAATLSPTAVGDPLAVYASLPPPIGATATWPIELFHWESGPEPGFTDLTGKRRLIQHGPYLLLSSGTWTAEIVFELSMDRAFTQLRFDWGDGTDIVETSQRLSSAGVYSVSLTKAWTRPTTTELRIWLDRSMFDGSLRIRSTKVSRTA